MTILILYLLLLILLLVFCTISLVVLVMLAMPYKLPFVRSTHGKTATMVKLLGDVTDKKIVDLGSGDGRVVIALAEAGAIAHGHEINFILVWWSRIRIKRAGLSKRAFVTRANFWKEDLSRYDAITLFGIKSIMPELEKKMLAEMRPGMKIVTERCEFPNWQPVATEDRVNLYIRE